MNGTSRYCDPCDLNWPFVIAYAKCPGCGRDTIVVRDLEPMGTLKASVLAHDLTLSRTRHEEFAKFCEERDAPIIEAEVTKFRAALDQFAGVPG